MKKLFAFLIVSLLLGIGVAAEFPSDGEIVVTAEGEVVGVGEFEDGDLELHLLEGFAGSATITVTDAEGDEYTVDVTVNGDGTLALDETSEDLAEVVQENGGEVEISVHEDLEVSANNAFGAGVPDHVDLPDVAVEGMDRAKSNHEAAKERSEENRAEAGATVDGRADGELGEGDEEEDEDEQDDDGEAEVDGEAEAGASANVGVGLGGRN